MGNVTMFAIYESIEMYKLHLMHQDAFKQTRYYENREVLLNIIDEACDKLPDDATEMIIQVVDKSDGDYLRTELYSTGRTNKSGRMIQFHVIVKDEELDAERFNL